VRTSRIDGNHRYSWTKNQRSAFVSRARPFILRRKTINCCRRAAFSASSRLFDLNGDPRIASTKRIIDYRDHFSSLADFVAASTRMRFSTHTGIIPWCLQSESAVYVLVKAKQILENESGDRLVHCLYTSLQQMQCQLTFLVHQLKKLTLMRL
jgi:hypothetical protein